VGQQPGSQEAAIPGRAGGRPVIVVFFDCWIFDGRRQDVAAIFRRRLTTGGRTDAFSMNEARLREFRVAWQRSRLEYFLITLL